MEVRKIEDLDKVEDITSTWLVIETWHERYAFSTQITTYVNRKLSEVAEELGFKFSDLSYCNIFNTHCKIDLTQHEEFKCGYESWEVKDIAALKDKVIPIHLESYLILNMNEDWENEYVWGQTNKKFGLLDIKDN